MFKIEDVLPWLQLSLVSSLKYWAAHHRQKIQPCSKFRLFLLSGLEPVHTQNVAREKIHDTRILFFCDIFSFGLIFLIAGSSSYWTSFFAAPGAVSLFYLHQSRQLEVYLFLV
jgi:hypothetical protein